jgi:hypothetical protein
MQKEKLIIGWNEYVDLTQWNIKGLKAKVDTGAKTSSIHVEIIEFLPRNRVSFYVILRNRKPRTRIKVKARILRKATVRSSLGRLSERLFVTTHIKIGPIEREIELNLVNRRHMRYRMLLGRTAFKEDFLVDAHHSCILTKRKRRQA